MESYLLEWLNLLGRWVHMIVGIAWIGASFYFVWLDNHLESPADDDATRRGVGGELWAVHGGGFYHAQKYRVAPPALPPTLHWFKWEAYTTWISGMFLLCLLYWYQAEIYLIDPNVLAIGKPVAVLIGMACIAGGWIAYDLLCKSALGNNDTLLAAVMFVILTLVAWALCQVFGGRGAYMHFGAMLGTIMVGNVFFVIMPGQRDLVAAKEQGREPEAIHGIRAKQRSVHNTYFTLPVLFVMISNHYAMTYGHAWNWLILIGISLVGALIRVWFVQRHFGRATPLVLIVAALILGAIVWALAPRPTTSQAVRSGTATTGTAGVQADSGSPAASLEPSFENVQAVVLTRCAGCHAQTPTYPGFYAPPKGIRLDTADTIAAQAAAVHQQSVATRAMPIGNLTGMTDEERQLIDRWFVAGAVTGQ